MTCVPSLKTLLVPALPAVVIAAWLVVPGRPQTQPQTQASAAVSSSGAAAPRAPLMTAHGRRSDAGERATASASTRASDDAERWAIRAASDDPRTRATAIAALAHAPKTVAVPALNRVVEAGHTADEQQIALSSLYTIAIEQGDDDERVRHAIRRAIYHGSDDSVSENAQALLEDIEAAVADSG